MEKVSVIIFLFSKYTLTVPGNLLDSNYPGDGKMQLHSFYDDLLFNHVIKSWAMETTFVGQGQTEPSVAHPSFYLWRL
jgi:hypothetical protein